MPDIDPLEPAPPSPSAAAEPGDAAPPTVRRKRGEPRPERESQEGKPIRRLQIAGNVAAQILLLVVLFGIGNYLNFRHHKRWDLSENRKYTLAEESVGFVGTLDKRVHITMAFLDSSKIALNLKALLDEYRRASKGKIKLDVFDPARDRNRATEISQKYVLSLEESTIIFEIDPQPDKTGLVRTVTESQMLDKEGRLFLGEDVITSTLIAATEGREKVVYFVTGHGPIRELDGRSAFDVLRDLSANQFFRLEKLNLTDVREIPEDADALFLLNPSLDFSEREIGMIRRFWDSERGALFAMLNPAGDTPNFHALLREFGIAPQRDRVLEASGNGMKNFEAQGQFMPNSPITRSLAGSSTTFRGQSSSLGIAEDDTELARRGIGIIALVQANPRFWGEFDFNAERPVLDPTDNAPPLYLAASIEKGASEDLRLRLDASRMVVIGNGSLLDPDHTTHTNTSFILAGLNWMLDRERLIGIPHKTAIVHRLEITPTQHERMFTIAVFILPAAAFSFGLFMWSARRQ